MTAARDERPMPSRIHDGVVVPGAVCSEIAAALDLLAGYLNGAVPPASVRAPRMTRAVAALLTATQEAAVDFRRRETRRANAAATTPPVAVLTPAITPAVSPQEITSGTAATIAGVSEARVRQLAASATIAGRKTDRNVWLLDPVSVRAYAARRRSRRTAPNGHQDRPADAGTAPAAGTQ